MHSPSPACLAALRDATARWPRRSKRSDGIMGDARHQAKPSDHNLGNAVDITHDPANGCDGFLVSRAAINDPRTQYVIFNREIWNVDRQNEGDNGWRPYHGDNPHTKHVHVSIKASMREDARRWPFADMATAPAPDDDEPDTAKPFDLMTREGQAAALSALGFDASQSLIDATIAFQRSVDLDDDGIIGPKTRRALAEELARHL